jgi:hypothetical protein
LKLVGGICLVLSIEKYVLSSYASSSPLELSPEFWSFFFKNLLVIGVPVASSLPFESTFNRSALSKVFERFIDKFYSYC